MQVHNIPGKLEVSWLPDVKAIHDKWSNYTVSLDDFRDAVLVKGIGHSKKNGGQAWIVDSSDAKGSFSQEIQEFIGAEVFKSFAANGIKYFITVASKSAVTNLTINRYSQKAGPDGLTLVEAQSLDDALQWLKDNG